MQQLNNQRNDGTVHAQYTHIHAPARTSRCACHAQHAPRTHHARTAHAPYMHVHAPYAHTRTQHGHARTHTHIIMCMPRTPLTQFMYGGVVKTSARRHTAPFAEVFSMKRRPTGATREDQTRDTSRLATG